MNSLVERALRLDRLYLAWDGALRDLCRKRRCDFGAAWDRVQRLKRRYEAAVAEPMPKNEPRSVRQID